MSKIDELIDNEDWGALIGVALNAWQKADGGVFCKCDTPDVTGYDLMCVECCLEVQSQRVKREKAMSEPHPYKPMPNADFDMCDFCSRWKDDPIHEEADHE